MAKRRNNGIIGKRKERVLIFLSLFRRRIFGKWYFSLNIYATPFFEGEKASRLLVYATFSLRYRVGAFCRHFFVVSGIYVFRDTVSSNFLGAFGDAFQTS